MPFLSFSSWLLITGFGSSGVMIPIALALAAWLAAAHNWRAALLWLGLLSAAIGVVVATKLAFIGWGIGIRSLDFTGISGHSMLSTAVFPVMLDTLLLPARRTVRRLGVAVGLACGVLIGASRFVLQAHSTSEIVAGCLLGAAVALLYVRITRGAEAARLPPLAVGASVCLLMATLHGWHVPTQRWVTLIALGLSGHDRPVVRVLWHKQGQAAPPRTQRILRADPDDDAAF